MTRTITITLHRHSKPPKPRQDAPTAAGVAWVSLWDRKVLLLLRSASADAHPLTWCFPAGKTESGETQAEAAVREFREETGCWNAPQARNVAPVWENERFSLFLYLGSKFGPILDGESEYFMWADIDNPPEPLHPGIQEQLQAIKNALVHYERIYRGRY